MAFELGNHTLVLHRRVPVLDGAGNPALTPTGREQVAVVDDTVPGCDWEVTESLETESATTVTRLDGRGMLPPGTPVAYTSAVTDPTGITFEVHGPPRPVLDINTSGVDHIAIAGRSFLNSADPASREEG